MRIEPIGKNGNGDTFWYFYGTRLYKESHGKKEPMLHNEDDYGRYSKKIAKGKLSSRRKRSKRVVESSSDYETG